LKPKDKAAQLEELGLRWGCVYVYRRDRQLYGWGDFGHCDGEDIKHNLREIAKRLPRGRNAMAGKAFDADLYSGKNVEPLPRIAWEVRNLYREKLFLLDAEGNILGEAEITPDRPDIEPYKPSPVAPAIRTTRSESKDAEERVIRPRLF
jgi:hypothetical protein